MSHASKSEIGRIQALEARVAELSSLVQITNIISSTLDLDELLLLVMDVARDVIKAEAASIFLVNETTGLLECELALGSVGDKLCKKIQLEKGQGVAGWVWENGNPLIVPNVEDDDRFYSDVDEKSGFHTKSILAAPLIVQNRFIGVGEVINRTDGHEFTLSDLDLFIAFCRQVALAIENARVHQMTIEQTRIRQQLAAAKEIQQSFMPQHLPKCHDNIFDIAAINLPATAVGGDLYDVLMLDDDHLAVFIGDVSGKGIPAALHMARLMSDFRFHVHLEEPQNLMNILNELVYERSKFGMFVTAQYCKINIRTGHVVCSDAGHLPLVHVHDGHSNLIHMRTGPPLGVLKETQYNVYEFCIQPGDMLCFYTDGLMEARNEQDNEYGLERLSALSAQEWKNAYDMQQAIIDDLQAFVGDMTPHDDITTVTFQKTF